MSRGLWFVAAYHITAWALGTIAVTTLATRRRATASSFPPAAVFAAAFAVSAVGLAATAAVLGVVRVDSPLEWLSLPPAVGVSAVVVLAPAVAAGLLGLEIASARFAHRAGNERGRVVEHVATTEVTPRSSATRQIALLAVGGVAEEFLWRGVLVGAVAERGHVLGALAFGALLFGASHLVLGLRNVALKSVAGAAWSLLYLSFGLVSACLSHALFNAGIVIHDTRVVGRASRVEDRREQSPERAATAAPGSPHGRGDHD